jgi:hypothetical protein
VGWIVGYLLLLVLLVAAVTELRQPLERRGRRRILSVADYAIQSLYHGLLLFVLPAYYASATLDSLNALFLAGVVAGALLTAMDPWYAARRCWPSPSSPPSTWRCPCSACGPFWPSRARRR